MIGYTCVGTNDLDKAVEFYQQLLGLFGAKPFTMHSDMSSSVGLRLLPRQ